jgi:predicted transposase/invertase (TIGR01784 family)
MASGHYSFDKQQADQLHIVPIFAEMQRSQRLIAFASHSIKSFFPPFSCPLSLARKDKTSDLEWVHRSLYSHLMTSPLPDRYISLLTDFGFKHVFGTEPNKRLLIDFLNTLLPDYHQIRDLTFKNNENLGNTLLDRKAIFDIYCEAENGDRFIVEIQKAKQNFFKDRSIYYASFPIQEQALKGDWNYELKPVYLVGLLDFVFDEHKQEDTLLHVIELKAQHCQVFYEKLKFIYIELPKFKKTLEQLETHFEKWLFLFRHLAQLDAPPPPLQEEIFTELFEVAEIANFSPDEQQSYQNSLKYYRDLNNVVDTSRGEGFAQGREAEAIALITRQLTYRLKQEPSQNMKLRLSALPLSALEDLSVALLDFGTLSDLEQWLANYKTM